MVILKIIIRTSCAKSGGINSIAVFNCTPCSRSRFNARMNKTGHWNTFHPWIFQRTHIDTILINVSRGILRTSFKRNMQILNAYIVADCSRIWNLVDICLCILYVERIKYGSIHFNHITFHFGDVAMIGNINILSFPFLAFICVALCIAAIPDSLQPSCCSRIFYTNQVARLIGACIFHLKGIRLLWYPLRPKHIFLLRQWPSVYVAYCQPPCPPKDW